MVATVVLFISCVVMALLAFCLADKNAVIRQLKDEIDNKRQEFTEYEDEMEAKNLDLMRRLREIESVLRR